MENRPVSIRRAILLGHLFVNGPVLIIIVAGGLLGWFLTDGTWRGAAFGAMAGSIIAWPWWSFAAPRWRAWALLRGAHPDELQRWGVLTGLVWPKGWIFEKTEIPVRKRDMDDGAA